MSKPVVLVLCLAILACLLWPSQPACKSQDVAVVSAILSQCCQSKGCLSYEQCQQAFMALGNLAHCSSEPDSSRGSRSDADR